MKSCPWPVHELLCLPSNTKYSTVKFGAICPTAEAWLKLGHAVGQWSQAHEQIYNRRSEKEKNQDAAIAQSKWNAVLGPQESCEEINVCRPQWAEAFEEGWDKIPPQ